MSSEEQKPKLLGLPWFIASRCNRCKEMAKIRELRTVLNEQPQCEKLPLCLTAEQIHIAQEVADNLMLIHTELTKIKDVLITLENPNWKPEG